MIIEELQYCFGELHWIEFP